MIAISTEWLEMSYIWPAEAGFTPDMTGRSKKLWQDAPVGTTTFNDMYNPNGVDIERLSGGERFQDALLFLIRPLFFRGETTAGTIVRELSEAIIEEILGYENPNFKVMVAPHSRPSNQDLPQASLDMARAKYSSPYGGDQGGVRHYPGNDTVNVLLLSNWVT